MKSFVLLSVIFLQFVGRTEMKNTITVKCPDCGRDITGMIDKALADYKFAIRSKGGRTTNAAKSEAQRANILKQNESYTTEKRKAAWAKRKANMALAKKNKAEE